MPPLTINLSSEEDKFYKIDDIRAPGYPFT